MLRFTTILTLCLSTFHAWSAPDKDLEFFERRVRPVLVQHCYECHSAEASVVKGGLRLDSRQGWEQGGNSGPVIRPGQPGQSLLVRAIQQEDPDLMMPPPKHSAPLPAAAVQDLTHWIKVGAPDPRDEAPTGTSSAPDRNQPHWAFEPPQAPEVPTPQDSNWLENEVDRFVKSAMESQDLAPNPRTDARHLIRRLHFDLVGLPPSPSQIREFEQAAQKDWDAAVTNLIEQLLDSPRFGERWGRHWLDVARFAESSGHERNFTYPHAWRYRDYVIAAFNEDKPYDQFIREQIAGDLLPPNSREQEVEQNIATGFLAIGPKNHLNSDQGYQLDLADDRIDTMSRSMLGLTMACARCHDHKYDPIETKEYYALAGIFTSTESLHGTVPGKGGGNNRHHSPLFVVSGDAEKAKELRQAMNKEEAAATEELKKLQKALVAIPRDNPTEEQAQKIAELKQKKDKVSDRIEELQHGPDIQVEYAMAAREAQKPADEAVRINGVMNETGDVVPRGFPAVLTHSEPPAIQPDESGRLALSEWLTKPDNPLTARVMVNRIWQHLFGRGLVSTVDNFGLLGAEPSHPELLDYLALRFMDEGWSVKDMIRLLTTSQSYQLNSAYTEASYAQDPDAIYLWRMRPRRLEVEPMRDAILSVSGQLELGPPPSGSVVAEMGDGCLERQIKTAPLQESYPWRSVYLPVVRFYAPDMFEAFDGAPATLALGERSVTTVPGQALFLLNNDFMVEQSSHASERLLAAETLSTEERISWAFELALGRPPSPAELTDTVTFLKDFPAEDPGAGWTALCQGLFTTAEFRYVY